MVKFLHDKRSTPENILGPNGELIKAIFLHKDEKEGRVFLSQGAKNARDPILDQRLEELTALADSHDAKRFKNIRRDVAIVKLRFGTDTGELLSRAQIGKRDDIKLSAVRIEAIENKILRLMRHPTRSRALRQFIPYAEKDVPFLAWGSTCVYDVAQIFGRDDIPKTERRVTNSSLNDSKIKDLNLSEQTLHELRGFVAGGTEGLQAQPTHSLLDPRWEYPNKVKNEIVAALKPLKPQPSSPSS